MAARRWRDPDRARRLCLAVLAACGAELIRAEAELLEQAVAIAASEQITVYDAAYVAAARREAHLLVSTDVKDLVQPGLAVAPDAKLE